MTRRFHIWGWGVFLSVSPVTGQVIYQTGFESPTFVDANLLGQDGWLSTNNPATSGRAQIQSGFAMTGLRSLRLDASVGIFTDYFWHPVNFTVPIGSEPILQVSWDMYLVGGAPKNSAGWGIDLFDDSSPVQRRVTAVIVDAANHLKIWNGATFYDTGVIVSRDAWHVLRVDLNYAASARVVSVYVDGVRAAVGLPFSATTTDAVAEVALYNIDGGADDQVFIDNFLVAGYADADADGVPNPDDICPATGPGEAVDGAGCSTVDTDADGITNDLDLCPNTPTCAIGVSAGGCPVDSDGDSVVDGCDNCLTMPNGPAEDNQADTDSDGLGNACDVCPERRPGDVNGDGVTNALDLAKFNDILTGSPASPHDMCAADLTDDLQVTEADIDPMIDLLLEL